MSEAQAPPRPGQTVAIVTGASRGVGRELVLALSARACAVVAVYLGGRAAAEAAVEDANAAGGIALTLRADVTDRLDVERLFDESVAAFGHVDVVVHTARATAQELIAQSVLRLRSGGVVLSPAPDPGVDQGPPGREPGLGTARVIGHPRLNGGPMSTQASTNGATTTPHRHGFPMRLEVVVLGVSDPDRAKAFYTGLGWRVDGDAGGNGYRIVQLTPPGSTASIIFGSGVTAAQPGAAGDLLLAVDDIEGAREELLRHGVDVSETFHDAGGSLAGGFFASSEREAPGPDPEGRSYATYARFSDPDGNTWLLQEIGERLPGRVEPEAYAPLAKA